VNEVRDAYLGLCDTVAALVGRRDVGDRWNDPSALADMTVGALAGHLASSVLQVDLFLDMPEPDGTLVTATEYFAAMTDSTRPGSELNAGVRARADEIANRGWARLYIDTGRAADRLRERLADVPVDRRFSAQGKVLLVDEFLMTRLVEMAVHLDDFARSLDLSAVAVPDDATTIAIAVLVGAARTRHGDRAVLRALTRRELQAADIFQIL
jgi:hypothetical protein